jgi:hypothetical protein
MYLFARRDGQQFWATSHPNPSAVQSGRFARLAKHPVLAAEHFNPHAERTASYPRHPTRYFECPVPTSDRLVGLCKHASDCHHALDFHRGQLVCRRIFGARVERV